MGHKQDEKIAIEKNSVQETLVLPLYGKDITVEELKKENEKIYLGTGAWRQPVLDPDEIITGVDIPVMEGYITGYSKFRLREAIDFAIVSVVYAYKLTDGVIEDDRIVLGGVAPVPHICEEAAEYLKGKKISEEVAAEAGALAAAGADPLE